MVPRLLVVVGFWILVVVATPPRYTVSGAAPSVLSVLAAPALEQARSTEAGSPHWRLAWGERTALSIDLGTLQFLPGAAERSEDLSRAFDETR